MNIEDSHTTIQTTITKAGESTTDPFSRRPTAPSILVVRAQKQKEKVDATPEPPKTEEKKPEAPTNSAATTKPKDNKKSILKIRPVAEKKDEDDATSLLKVHDTLQIDVNLDLSEVISPNKTKASPVLGQRKTSNAATAATAISLDDYKRRRGLI